LLAVHQARADAHVRLQGNQDGGRLWKRWIRKPYPISEDNMALSPRVRYGQGKPRRVDSTSVRKVGCRNSYQLPFRSESDRRPFCFDIPERTVCKYHREMSRTTHKWPKIRPTAILYDNIYSCSLTLC
jgi:hypothetical protein